MDQGNLSRRGFLQRSIAALTVGAGLPAWYAQEILAAQQEKAAEKKVVAANDRINMGVIGMGPPPRRARDLYSEAKGNKQAQFVACCNVDKSHLDWTLDQFKKDGFETAGAGYKDYREMLDRKDIDAVLIAVPDQWHTLIAIDALRKKKDVYCEKPLTLTVAEGQALLKVAKGTDRVFQVGSQQRSDARFRLACELVRNGRIGKIKTVETRIGGIDKNKTGPFTEAPIPDGLDWTFWQGQVAKVPFVPQRCHYEFRWWYEYSGGKMTDWGAHHNDIAQWGLGMDESGPIAVEGTGVADTRPNCYNVHSDFTVKYKYANGAELICTANGENGVKFIGEDGKWIFVSRGTINASDKALLDEKLPENAVRLYKSDNHMGNFFECLKTRKPTICTAEIGHHSVNVCHIGVIALRTGKKLKWDPAKETFDDADANKMLSRPMDKPWKLDV
jgi:predicted dehydrogenase